MKKNREMFSGLTAWLVSACFFLGCFANKQLLEKISKLGNSHILIYIGLVLSGISGMYVAYRKNEG